MDYSQQKGYCVIITPKCGFDPCQLKLVNFEAHDNHLSHQTQGLSDSHLVVRRGKPFKFTLMFHNLWSPRRERLVLEVQLGNMAQTIPVQDGCFSPLSWSAKILPGDMHHQSVTIHLCCPVSSAVGVYTLLGHFESRQGRRSFVLGAFVLLCNPWLKEDCVYMQDDEQIEEYVRNDYGILYVGSNMNVGQRLWSFGQYEPGVLEACLQLLQVSPLHLCDKNRDYSLRGDPVYISRVICAMVNCQDDLGILQGKWQGSYDDGVRPTEWSSSADILLRWAESNFSPVRYGQCWVFASVLCTVMRVLGIPSRVVTVNFHVWVECWMTRPDVNKYGQYDGWQVVDPTPQERSDGIFRCGPCPVAAVQDHFVMAEYDTKFVCASVDADVVRMIVHDGMVLSKKVDTEVVGKLIYTKSVGSDSPENLTDSYKKKHYDMKMMTCSRSCQRGMYSDQSFLASMPVELPSDLEVSLKIEGTPTMGESIRMCVMVTNNTSNSRVLKEYLSAQVKEYNSHTKEAFWKTEKDVHIKPYETVTHQHTIAASAYESAVGGDAEDFVKVAVVIEDMGTKERALYTEEFNIISPQIDIEIKGGDSIQMSRQYVALVSFTNTFTKAVREAVLTVEGSGLLKGKQETSLDLLKPGEKIEKQVSIMASSPGTKVLKATFSQRGKKNTVSRTFHKVSVS
ncbi:hypothetical protein INR49_030542 [Caranx melampygus]|nr:hypothetical protein INR49_030542 [Caranx melampygus]